MNKTAIKNFAIWARNKLIADIIYKAGLLGITGKEIKNPLPQSTKDVQFFDIGTKEPYSITGVEIVQRRKLAEAIQQKAKQSDYKTAYKVVIEEVAYTWFNRLIAVRFMEVNDYLPTRIRVLSSESSTKIEPDMVTSPFDADLDYSPYEKDRIMQLKNENLLDELFRMLFIKQCNALNAILPELFEKTNDYTELLMNVSFTDKDGVVYRLVNDIREDDFNVEKEGQVEIIGWLYQYYNTEPKDETFALLKKNVKITKERIPAATQLFTPDWIVSYMVENSLGRLWLERERASSGLTDEYLNAAYFGWKYYMEEAPQEPEVEAELAKIREEYKSIKPEDIKVIDPCMGSGHILVYAFDVLMQIYERCGYSQRDATKSILENNLYGLDIDNRAYQLAYFAVMMKARQYNRRIFNGDTKCNLYAIQESNGINREHLKYFGAGMDEKELNIAKFYMQGLFDTFADAKEYGSLLEVENYNWQLLYRFIENVNINNQMTFDAVGINDTQKQLSLFFKIGFIIAQKYDVVITNPPYMGNSGMDSKLSDYLKGNYPNSKMDMFSCFIEKCYRFAKHYGFISMITMESWMFLSSFEKFRSYILNNSSIINMTHMPYLGKGGTSLGISFGTVAFSIKKATIANYTSRYNYVRYFETNDSGIPLSFPTNNERLSQTKQDRFGIIPGSPIAYWVHDSVYFAYLSGKRIGDIGEAKQGLATGDNERFIRIWYEVSYDSISFDTTDVHETYSKNTKWYPYNKGGEYRKWYGNQDFVVNWENNGIEIRNFKNSDGKLNSRPQNIQYYFKPCCTWSLTNSRAFGARIKEAGFIFDINGMSLFVDDKYLYYVLAFLCSNVCSYLMKINNPTFASQAGDIAKLPFIIDETKLGTINALVVNNIQIARENWDSKETSWGFSSHPLTRFSVNKIKEAFIHWEQQQNNRIDATERNEVELNHIFNKIFNVHDKECFITQPVTLYVPHMGSSIKEFLSYAVGCMFGRYSLDFDGIAYAGGEWDDSKYSTFIPDKDNIIPITDEEYFEDDVVGLFCAFLKKTFGEETLEENLDFIAKALGNKGNSSREIIRNYFLKDFYKDHCKIYQKRPIYWLFDSGKADGFKALIYMHRYNEDTIGNLRIDYLHRMQRVYESEIARMQGTIDSSSNGREVTAATKRKEKLIKQLKETKEYDEKIAHLALSRIAIDLDDGVKVNYEKVQTGTDGKKLEVLAKI